MKPRVHRRLTAVALELCHNSLSDNFYSYAQEIINGSDIEDTTKLFERITNWHFYRSEESPISDRVYCCIRPTSEHLLQKRIDQMLQYSKDDKRRYEYLGRVLHHIQDMSTPAHVLPIYHGPIKQDYFENFIEEHVEHITFESTMLPTDTALEDGLMGLYDLGAKRTINSVLHDGFVVKTDTEEMKLPLTRFWQDHRLKESFLLKGFGSYGDLNSCFNDYKSSDYSSIITEEIMLGIQKKFCDTAIVDTCKALLYADNL